MSSNLYFLPVMQLILLLLRLLIVLYPSHNSVSFPFAASVSIPLLSPASDLHFSSDCSAASEWVFIYKQIHNFRTTMALSYGIGPISILCSAPHVFNDSKSSHQIHFDK